MRNIILVLAIIVVAGCSSTPTEMPYVRFDGQTGPMLSSGSGIQWNEDYVVTTKHATFVKNSEFVCDTGLDLQFVRQKSTTKIPQWRDPVANEKLTAIGVTMDQYGMRSTVIAEGFDNNTQVRTESNGKDNKVNLATTQTVVGMSGGPMYSADKKVVGMLTSSVFIDNNGKSEKRTVYIPYEKIKQQWDKFQSGKQILSQAKVNTSN